MVEFDPVPGITYQYDYLAIFKEIGAGRLSGRDVYRQLCKEDLFFLLYFGLEQTYIHKPFVVDRCIEVGADTDNTLDLWAREHFKSTLLTYGGTIQDLILDQEERIAIFSHTRPIAKGFLRQIKQTLESYPPLVAWFPDIFFRKPKSESIKWSEDDGLVIRRKSKSKEASVEAWGLVDGQPTSKHFSRRKYDDIVTRESVTSPEMIKKTSDAFELSHSLGTDGGKKNVAGTHYHFNDLYTTLKTSGTYKVREYPATDDGTAGGDPVLLSHERLGELRQDQGSYVFSCQQLLNPVEAGNQTFNFEDIEFWPAQSFRGLNPYMIIDPANEKKKKSDYTAIIVAALGADDNFYILCMLRDKLNLEERTAMVFSLHRQYSPLKVYYETYGMQADTQHIKYVQEKENYRFKIIDVGGNVSKPDRIRRLIPVVENHRLYLPYRQVRKVWSGDQVDHVQEFINDEVKTFPYSLHDDFLDVIARLVDPRVKLKRPGKTKGKTKTVVKTSARPLSRSRNRSRGKYERSISV